MKTKIALLILCSSVLFLSLTLKEHSTAKLLSDPEKKAYGHYLANDHDNNPVISWIEEDKSSGKNQLIFSISYDQGKTFSAPIKVAGSEGCHDGHGEGAPKVAFKKDGTIIAVFSKRKPTAQNPFAGSIEYVLSVDKGKSWSKTQKVHTDEEGNSHAFHDVAVLPDGEIGIIWLDTRNAERGTGSELYWAKTYPGRGFGTDKRIAMNTCQCCRTRLYVTEEGKVFALYRGLLKDGCRDILLISSNDGGKNFTKPVCISNDKWKIKGCPHAGPNIAEASGILHFVWFTGASETGIYYTFSKDKGKTFHRKQLISKKGRQAQVTSFAYHSVIMSWTEPIEINGKFYNQVVIKDLNSLSNKITSLSDASKDSVHPISHSLSNKGILAAWLEKEGESSKLVYRIIHL